MKNCLDSGWTPLLMKCFDANKRDLPWRTESPRDPYKVWVSEIMLQKDTGGIGKDLLYKLDGAFPEYSHTGCHRGRGCGAAVAGAWLYSYARNLHTAVREVLGALRWQMIDTRLCNSKRSDVIYAV